MNTTPTRSVKPPAAPDQIRKGVTIPASLHERIAQAADRLGYASPNEAAEQVLRLFMDRPDVALERLAEGKAGAQGVTPPAFSAVADLLQEWKGEGVPARPPRWATVPEGSLPVFLSEALVVGMERLVVAAGLDDDEPFGLVGALVEAMVENTLADSGQPGGGFEVHMPDIWNLSDERKRDLERAAATQRFTPRDWEAGTPAKLVIEVPNESEEAPAGTQMAAAHEQPSAPAIGSPEDVVMVPLPGWMARFYGALAARYGWADSFGRWIEVALDEDFRDALKSKTGDPKGLANEIMDVVKHCKLPLTPIDDIVAQAKYEAACWEAYPAAETEKGGPTA